MTTNLRRPAVAGLALLATVALGACGDNSQDDVTNPPVDDSSTTPPEEQDQGGEEDTGGHRDD